MSTHPQIVIAALNGDRTEFVDGPLTDESAFRNLLAHKPDVFSIARVKAGDQPEQTYARLRRNIVKSVAATQKHWDTTKVHIFNLQNGRPRYDEVLQPKNDSIVWVIDSFQEENLDRLIDSLLANPHSLVRVVAIDHEAPKVEHTSVLPSREEAGRQRRERLLQKEEWYSSEQVHAIVRGGSKATNVSQTAAELRRKRRLLGVSVAGQYKHPAVQFDADEGRVLPVMQKLLEIMPAAMGEWASVNWLFQGRKSLDSRRPADVLASNPEGVLQAARDDFAPSAETW